MIFSFLFIYIFVVNIVYYVVHNIVCEVDVIANSLVLYLPFCSTLNENVFFFFFIPCFPAGAISLSGKRMEDWQRITRFYSKLFTHGSIVVAFIVVPFRKPTQSKTPGCICFSSQNVTPRMTTTSLSTVLTITIVTLFLNIISNI